MNYEKMFELVVRWLNDIDGTDEEINKTKICSILNSIILLERKPNKDALKEAINKKRPDSTLLDMVTAKGYSDIADMLLELGAERKQKDKGKDNCASTSYDHKDSNISLIVSNNQGSNNEKLFSTSKPIYQYIDVFNKEQLQKAKPVNWVLDITSGYDVLQQVSTNVSDEKKRKQTEKSHSKFNNKRKRAEKSNALTTAQIQQQTNLDAPKDTSDVGSPIINTISKEIKKEQLLEQIMQKDIQNTVPSTAQLTAQAREQWSSSGSQQELRVQVLSEQATPAILINKGINISNQK